MSSDGWYKMFTTALIAGTGTTATVFLGYMAIQDNETETDWRNLAAIGSIGTFLGVRYAITGKALLSLSRR